MGPQGHPECGGVGEGLVRPKQRGKWRGDLAGEAMPGAVETRSIPRISPLAGKPVPKEMLVDVARLEREYFDCRPDVTDSSQLVSFGTNGHRGSPFHGSFTEAHILAIPQAICDYRRDHGTDGLLYMG